MVKQPKDIIQVQGINSQGYGTIPKLVMQDKRLTIQAKAIYGYFCTYAGAGKTAFPGRKKIMSDLKISKDSYYKHFKLLKDCGYIEAYQEKDENGVFCRNIYTLVESIPCPKYQDAAPCPKLPCPAEPCPVEQDTNNNSIKINSINNYQSVSQDLTDGTDRQPFADVLEVIQENVSYNDLQAAYGDDIDLIHGFIGIILDVFMTEDKTVRVNGENKLRELVKSNLLKLRYDNIVHVLEQFKAQEHRIKNKRQYILSMLYNSPMEIDAHYTNWVQSDLFGKGEGNG